MGARVEVEPQAVTVVEVMMGVVVQAASWAETVSPGVAVLVVVAAPWEDSVVRETVEEAATEEVALEGSQVERWAVAG